MISLLVWLAGSLCCLFVVGSLALAAFLVFRRLCEAAVPRF